MMPASFSMNRDGMSADTSPGPSRRRPPCLRSLWLAFIASLCLAIGHGGGLSAYAERGRQDQLAPLTAIGAIRALTPEIAKSGRRVSVRGTVTYINEREPAGLIVHDGSAGLFVRYGPRYFLKQARVELHPGDVVEVDGYTSAEGFAPDVVPDMVRRVGRSVLPPAKRVPYASLLSGVFDCDYIEVVGVGQRAWVSESGKTLFVDIAVEGGAVRAWFWDFSAQDLTRFIDARVRLRGNAGTLYNQTQASSRHLAVRRTRHRRHHRHAAARSVVASGSRDLQPVHPSRQRSD